MEIPTSPRVSLKCPLRPASGLCLSCPSITSPSPLLQLLLCLRSPYFTAAQSKLLKGKMPAGLLNLSRGLWRETPNSNKVYPRRERRSRVSTSSKPSLHKHFCHVSSNQRNDQTQALQITDCHFK